MRSFAQACLLLVTTVTLSLKPSLCSERLNCTVLQVLNVQPYPDDGVFAGFDRGLDLVPAAHLAAEQINNLSDILAEFNLEIVDIDSEACGREIITKGLVNFYKELVSQDPSRCRMLFAYVKLIIGSFFTLGLCTSCDLTLKA